VRHALDFLFYCLST